MRAICLTLPDTHETMTWGEPYFRVNDKIFAGVGVEDEKVTIGMKLEKLHANARIQEPHIWPAKYVGQHGWITIDTGGIDDWNEIQDLVLESYRLIAPKRSLAKLDH
jgi:predicted DNA-binding protein (MmcQ/YjbR family)